jgi:hypothetical protein
MTVIMVDGINFDEAAILARWGSNTPVAIPVDGHWAWTAQQGARFAHKIHYSVLAGPAGWQAARGRCLDVESRWRVGGDAGAQDVAPFIDARRHVAGFDTTTIYCSLATFGSIPADVRAEVPRWWLAWYWGRPAAPTQADVLAELERLTGDVLPAGRLWACQFASYGQWDVSAVYGAQDWSR